MRAYRPTSPGRRFGASSDFSGLTPKPPEKGLVAPLTKTGGRNNRGCITSRHRGGGHKRKYRIVDFKRRKDGIPARVAAIEYDPNRTARIALLVYADGEKRYILAPEKLTVGMTVESGVKLEPRVGNCMELGAVPLGMAVHNIELVPMRGGQLVRTAGSSATVSAREGGFVHLILPSKEIRRVSERCRATLGVLSNIEHNSVHLGKAGRSRWLGVRPKVRGVAQNPVSHPMGGGEGRSSGGRHPCSPWGKPSKGGKTRKKRKDMSNIIRRRRK